MGILFKTFWITCFKFIALTFKFCSSVVLKILFPRLLPNLSPFETFSSSTHRGESVRAAGCPTDWPEIAGSKLLQLNPKNCSRFCIFFPKKADTDLSQKGTWSTQQHPTQPVAILRPPPPLESVCRWSFWIGIWMKITQWKKMAKSHRWSAELRSSL